MDESSLYDVIIVGGGVAGLSAGMYAGRLGLKSAVIGKDIGGTITLTQYIENWPGFKKIETFELTDMLEEHATSYGVEIIEKEVTEISIERNRFKCVVGGDSLFSRAVILATGTERRKLKVKGYDRFENRNIHYCAFCDGPNYRGKRVAVIGGGDAAVVEAIVLAGYAEKIYVISRSELHAEPANLRKLENLENIEVLNGYNVLAFEGGETLERIKLDREYEEKWVLEVDGVFISLGGVPNSNLAIKLGVETNEKGEIVVNEAMETNVPGVFAAGDVVANPFKQAIISSAQGVMAAYSAYRFITGRPVYTCILDEYAEPGVAGAEDVKKALERGALVIDVRERDEYEKAHIPTAIFGEIKRLEELEDILKDVEEIYVYSKDYDCPASTIAAKKLAEMGFCNVYDFKGSFKEWVEKGYEIERFRP
jgi:thioredoxin reductase (NADPH)